MNYATGVISGTMANSAAEQSGGSYTVTVFAEDDNGDNGLATFTWTVTNVNPAPELLSVPTDFGGDTGEEISFFVFGYDPDGDTVTYSASGLPDGLAIDDETGEISGTIDTEADGNAAPVP